MLFCNQQQQYEIIEGESDEKAQATRPSFKLRSIYLYVLFSFVLLGSLPLSFLAGRYSVAARMPNTHGLLLPPGEVEQVWEHNLTFSSEPTPQSEAAWASIIPIGRGFIHQPELAPFVSSIAVFHQLHCLVGQSFVASNATISPERLTFEPAQHARGVLLPAPGIGKCQRLHAIRRLSQQNR